MTNSNMKPLLLLSLLPLLSCVQKGHVVAFYPNGTPKLAISGGGHVMSTEENSFSYVKHEGTEITYSAQNSDSAAPVRIAAWRALIGLGIGEASDVAQESVKVIDNAVSE